MSYQLYCPKCDKHLGGVALSEGLSDQETKDLVESMNSNFGRELMGTCLEHVCHYE